MGQVRRCPKGHQWEAPAHIRPSSVDTACPLCSSIDAGLLPPPPTKPPVLPPPEVPGYEVLGELGSGGMGVVYRARHASLQRLVALKMIQPPPGITPPQWEQLLRRFRTEAEAVARLRHPNIIQIHDWGEHRGLPFFSLEYCPGGSLQERLDGTPWPADRAAALIETLARAVHSAHESNVVHRDIKPANILLAEDGAPKVSDFGLAKKLDSPGQTESGAIIGTASYMAPEQARGRAKEVGPAADIWALGAMLYELLTGRPPFLADTTLHTLMQVVEDEPVPPRRLQSQVPRQLETICLHCLRKEPQKRYRTAVALAEDLQRFREGRPPLVSPPGPIARTWMLYRRNKVVGTLLVLLAIVLISGISLTAALYFEARREYDAQVDANRHLSDSGYASGIALAYRECQANNIGAARRILDLCPPDHQGWERGYVHRITHAEQHVLGGHQGEVLTVAFGPKSDLIASGGKDGTILVRDLATCEVRHTLRGHEKQVRNVAFSGKGVLASGGEDGTVRTWDLATEQGRILGKHTASVAGIAFHPDDRRLASIDKEGNIHLWDVDRGNEIASWRADRSASGLAFDPAGKRLAVAGDSSFSMWGVEDHKEIGALEVSAIMNVAFHPDGKRLILCSQDDAVLVRDTEKKSTTELRGNLSGVNAVAVSPDGRQIASAGWDGTVCVWRTPRQGRADKPVVLRGHGQRVACVAFSPDGRLLASGGDDGQVRLWAAGVNPEYTILGDAFVEASGLAFRPDGRQLAVATWHLRLTDPRTRVSSGEVRLFDPAGGANQTPITLHGHDGHVTAIAYSADGKLLASGGEDGNVLLWSPDRGVHLRTLDGPKSAVHGLVFVGDQLASAGEDGKLRLWNIADGQCAATLEGHKGSITAMAAGGELVVTGGVDQTVRLWDLAAKKEVRVLEGLADKVTAVSVSADGARIAAGTGDGSVTLWDRQGKYLDRLYGHSGAVHTLSFHPTEHRLASAGGQKQAPGEIKIWDVESRQELLTLRNRSGAFSGVAFSPDGVTLASVDTGVRHEGEVWLWSAEAVCTPPEPARLTIRSTATLTAHKEAVVSLAFSGDNQFLASGGDDGKLWLWEVLNDKTAVLPGHSDSVTSLQFLPGGHVLASGSADRAVKLWDAKEKKLIAKLDSPTPILSLATAGDGHILAGALEDGAIARWDVPARRLLSVNPGNEKTALSVSLAGDNTLAACFQDQSVRLFSTSPWKQRQTIQPILMPARVVLGRDEQLVLIAGNSIDRKDGRGIVKFWDTGIDREQVVFDQMETRLRSFDISADGNVLAAGLQNGDIWMCDLRDRKELWFGAHDGPVRSVRISKDGTMLASGGEDRKVRLWKLSFGK
jgi:WD40 repeat protein